MVIDTLTFNVVHSRSYNYSKKNSSFPHMGHNFHFFFEIYLSKSYDYFIFSIFTINLLSIGR